MANAICIIMEEKAFKEREQVFINEPINIIINDLHFNGFLSQYEIRQDRDLKNKVKVTFRQINTNCSADLFEK